jgi:hypothetical protein
LSGPIDKGRPYLAIVKFRLLQGILFGRISLPVLY